MPFENFEDKIRKKLEQAEVSPSDDLWQKIDTQLYTHRFEDTLKQKFQHASITPSKRVWDNIYAQLHGNKKRGVFAYWKHIASMAAILCFAVWFFSPKINKTTSNQVATTHKPTSHSPLKNSTPPIHSNHNPSAFPKTIHKSTNHSYINETFSTSTTPNQVVEEQELVSRPEDSKSDLKSVTKQPPILQDNIAQQVKQENITQNVTTSPNSPQPDAMPTLALRAIQPIEMQNAIVEPVKTKTTISFKELLLKGNENKPLEEDIWWANNETTVPEKRNRWKNSVSAGNSKISYNSFQSYPIESWNRLGIGSVAVLDDSVGNQVLNYPRQLGEVTGSRSADIELLVSKNAQYAGWGMGYELAKWLDIESGIKVHYQKVRTFTIPLDAIESANKAGVFNPYQALVKNTDSDYITRGIDNSPQKIEVNAKNNWIAEIPLMLRFKLPFKRSTISASTGVSYRQLLNDVFTFGNQKPMSADTNVSLLPVQNTSESRIDKIYRNKNATINLRLEYAYRINAKNSVFLAGTSQWFMQPMFGDNTTLRYPRLFGLETGMRF